MPTTAFATLDAVRPTPAAPASCHLALVGPEGGAWIELTGDPQTIGGGPRCTVRLDAPGLKPLHCVITPTDRGAVVRRWADQTELNGRSFDEAALSAGDLLRIGAVNLRVVAMPTPTSSAPEPVAQPAPTPQPTIEPAPKAEVAPALSTAATPSDTADAWYDNSIELVQAAEEALAEEDATQDFDPAIPKRLLKPWAPEKQPASVAAELAAQELVEPATPLAAESAVHSVPANNDDLWSVAPAPVALAPEPKFDNAAAAAFAAEPVALPPQAPLLGSEPSSEPEAAPAQAIEPTAERLRLVAARERVRRLVAALRRERELLGAWSEACSERDNVIIELQARLEEALTAVQRSGEELARLSASANQAAQDAAPNVFSDVTIDTAATEGPANTTSAPGAAWQEYDHLRDAADMTPASPWGVAEELEPAPSEPLSPETEFPPSALPETELPETDAIGEEGSMWGIEQLAAETAPEHAASLWVEPTAPEEAAAALPESAHQLEAEALPASTDERESAAEEAFATPAVPEPQAIESTESREAVSFIERFAHLVPDEDAPAEPVAAIAAPSVQPVSHASGEEDDSIDDYMRKLMERVRGGGGESPASSQAPAARSLAPEPVKQQAETTAAEPIAPQAPIRDLSEIRRTPMPAAKTDLGALRQLANQSARSAIDVANSRDSREKASLRLVASAVLLGCGALAAVTSLDPFAPQFIAGISAAAGGGWLGYRTLRSCQAASTKAEHDALANSAD